MSYLSLDVHRAEGCLLGHLECVASLAGEDAYVVVFLLQERVAAVPCHEIEACSMHVAFEQLSFFTLKSELFGEEVAADVWLVPVRCVSESLCRTTSMTYALHIDAMAARRSRSMNISIRYGTMLRFCDWLYSWKNLW